MQDIIGGRAPSATDNEVKAAERYDLAAVELRRAANKLDLAARFLRGGLRSSFDVALRGAVDTMGLTLVHIGAIAEQDLLPPL